MAPGIEIAAIQLPGRAERYNELPFTCLQSLVGALMDLMLEESGLPFAFFGHSLGGLVAFELARALQAAGRPLPLHLFVSGSTAPALLGEPRNLHMLPDTALIEELRVFNGTPVECLENDALMSLVLPMVRGDFEMAEKYAYRPEQLLPVPFTVLAGKKDRRDSIDEVTGWARESCAKCSVEWFEGDHFFIHTELSGVTACVNRELAQYIARIETPTRPVPTTS